MLQIKVFLNSAVDGSGEAWISDIGCVSKIVRVSSLDKVSHIYYLKDFWSSRKCCDRYPAADSAIHLQYLEFVPDYVIAVPS